MIDINSENSVILLEADVGENEQSIPEKRLRMGVWIWVTREEKM